MELNIQQSPRRKEEVLSADPVSRIRARLPFQHQYCTVTKTQLRYRNMITHHNKNRYSEHVTRHPTCPPTVSNTQFHDFYPLDLYIHTSDHVHVLLGKFISIKLLEILDALQPLLFSCLAFETQLVDLMHQGIMTRKTHLAHVLRRALVFFLLPRAAPD